MVADVGSDRPAFFAGRSPQRQATILTCNGPVVSGLLVKPCAGCIDMVSARDVKAAVSRAELAQLVAQANAEHGYPLGSWSGTSCLPYADAAALLRTTPHAQVFYHLMLLVEHRWRSLAGLNDSV